MNGHVDLWSHRRCSAWSVHCKIGNERETWAKRKQLPVTLCIYTETVHSVQRCWSTSTVDVLGLAMNQGRRQPPHYPISTFKKKFLTGTDIAMIGKSSKRGASGVRLGILFQLKCMNKLI